MLELIWCHKKRESLLPAQLGTTVYDTGEDSAYLGNSNSCQVPHNVQ
jgi:hypothetical protein